MNRRSSFGHRRLLHVNEALHRKQPMPEASTEKSVMSRTTRSMHLKLTYAQSHRTKREAAWPKGDARVAHQAHLGHGRRRRQQDFHQSPWCRGRRAGSTFNSSQTSCQTNKAPRTFTTSRYYATWKVSTRNVKPRPAMPRWMRSKCKTSSEVTSGENSLNTKIAPEDQKVKH